jgi:hypothetical protein
MVASLRIRFGTKRAVGRLVFGLTWFLGCGGLARAQALPDPTMPAASVPLPAPAPGYATMPPQPANSPDIPETSPVSSPTTVPPPVEMGLLDTITESLFGDVSRQPSNWTPQTLGTFFSEGWLQPWIAGPPADGGGLRQGWLDSFDGVFYRQVAGTFTYNNDWHKNGNQYVGVYTQWAPLSRRFEMRLDVPFIVSNKGGRNNKYHGNIGDLLVTPVFMLSESKNFSQTLSVFVNVPTGKTANGNALAAVNPQYQFWAGFDDGWVVRGGVGVNVPTNSVGARTAVNYNVAVGKFFNKDFSVYLAANGNSTVDNSGPSAHRGPSETFFELTPGFRWHMGNNWFALGGVEVPLTGPRTNGYAFAPIFQVVKGF